MVGAHPGFLSMKYILLVPPEWDASPSQGYPTAPTPLLQEIRQRYPFIQPGEERQSGVKFLV